MLLHLPKSRSPCDLLGSPQDPPRIPTGSLLIIRLEPPPALHQAGPKQHHRIHFPSQHFLYISQACLICAGFFFCHDSLRRVNVSSGLPHTPSTCAAALASHGRGPPHPNRGWPPRRITAYARRSPELSLTCSPWCAPSYQSMFRGKFKYHS